MTDNTNVDPAGAGGVANPPASPEPVDGNAELLSKLVEAIDERLKPIKGEIGGLYSRQDKDRNAFREFMDEYNKQKGKGLSDNDAYTAAEGALGEREKAAKKDKMLEEIYQKFVGPSSTPSPGTGQGGAVDAAKVVADYGLDPKDPNLAIVVNGHYPNQEAAELAVARYIKAQRQAPNPTQAQAPAPTGGQPQAKDVEELKTEYIQKMQAARGKPSEITRLRDEYRQKGVKSWEVSF